jgi:V/A-type H+-transporting ATPase subunit D
MPKVKLTKTALKQQRDSLKQFQRFLPTLQLKKQQLQMEMRGCQERIRANEAKEKELKESLSPWIALFGEDAPIGRIVEVLTIETLETGRANIAGVDVPVFKSLSFSIGSYDLVEEDPWFDDAIDTVKRIIEVQTEREVIREQYRLIGRELRVTTQRVNLFEKVKIPECKESIRTIQIYLGDMDTAAVGRSKIAKRKLQETAA